MVCSTSNTLILICVAVVIALVVYAMRGGNKKEGYRDPIYLNRQKMVEDWYPRANGSIYGFPYRYGGSWDIFSGFPYYNRAY